MMAFLELSKAPPLSKPVTVLMPCNVGVGTAQQAQLLKKARQKLFPFKWASDSFGLPTPTSKMKKMSGYVRINSDHRFAYSNIAPHLATRKRCSCPQGDTSSKNGRYPWYMPNSQQAASSVKPNTHRTSCFSVPSLIMASCPDFTWRLDAWWWHRCSQLQPSLSSLRGRWRLFLCLDEIRNSLPIIAMTVVELLLHTWCSISLSSVNSFLNSPKKKLLDPVYHIFATPSSSFQKVGMKYGHFNHLLLVMSLEKIGSWFPKKNTFRCSLFFSETTST